MEVDGETRNMVSTVVENYERAGLDGLIVIGGGGTAKNAMRLQKAGLNVLTLPKTIDNDIAGTDTTFGFATATEIATEAIDRVHSTAHSHHRIIVCEVMGHNAGWLALGAGIAGGADVILIPEIPYRVDSVVNAIKTRTESGSKFSIVAVAEGAQDVETNLRYLGMVARRKATSSGTPERAVADAELAAFDLDHTGHSLRLARQLETLTGLESRVSILGYVQRGGTPSATDRVLAARLGNAGAALVADGEFGVMVASRGDSTRTVPLDKVAGRLNLVPLEHELVATARNVGTCLGD
jgi:6-phosphofructokinase 1